MLYTDGEVVIIHDSLPQTSQRAHGVKMSSFWRRCPLVNSSTIALVFLRVCASVCVCLGGHYIIVMLIMVDGHKAYKTCYTTKTIVIRSSYTCSYTIIYSTVSELGAVTVNFNFASLLNRGLQIYFSRWKIIFLTIDLFWKGKQTGRHQSCFPLSECRKTRCTRTF